MMAASMPGPLSFNSQIPVTPPPDHQTFMKNLFPPNAFQQPNHHNHNHQHHAQPRYSSGGLGLHESTPSNSTTSRPHARSEVDHPPYATTSPRQQPMQPPPPLRTSTPNISRPAATSPVFPPNLKPSPFPTPSLSQPPPGSPPPIDPHYLAITSRIATYYQQRCAAVATFQHHRCQQWAAAQRAKCQEMTQAAMLVVAWYIRDRINRRRKRQNKSFKRALSTKNNNKAKVTKGETVRRWVMGVPLRLDSEGASREMPKDETERDFDMDRVVENEGEGDKNDEKLFEVADGLIKSQLARIEVPLLGVLDLGEEGSESESESESEVEEEEDEEREEEEEYEDEEEEEEYEEEEEMVVGDKQEEETLGSLSKDAQLGTDRRKSRDSSVL